MINIPLGPFKDFSDCVRHFEDDPDISDPEAFCSWMEEEEKEGKIKGGDKVIWGAEVEFMSLVSTPAVMDSEFLQIKERSKNPDKVMVKGLIPLLRRKSQGDMNDRMVYAPALIPDKADGNHEAISKDEIKKAAIKYMEYYRKVDNEHSFMDGDGIPIFSWILQKDEALKTVTGEEKMYPEGTWMMGIKVTSDKVWDMIKSGERTGFSIAGSWKVLEIKGQKAKGPGGHTPDGTGPYGVGGGPGGGRGDGSGMGDEDEEDDDEDNSSQSSSEKEQPKPKVTKMDEEEFMKYFEKAYVSMKEKEAKERSQKEADDELSKMKERLEKAEKELEELKADKSDAPEDKKEDEEEDDEEGEKQDEEEDDEEKEEYEDEEEEEEKKEVKQKATKSYDSKLPEKKPETKHGEGIKSAEVTVKKYPLGDTNHE